MNKNRYVISVGWDKNVNIYSDAPDGGVHHIQHPLPKWPDDVVRQTYAVIFMGGGLGIVDRKYSRSLCCQMVWYGI